MVAKHDLHKDFPEYAEQLDSRPQTDAAFAKLLEDYAKLDQQILDLPHRDLRRARAAGLSIIPTSTGAAKAMSLVIPELKGKLDGLALRVPTPNVSLVDFVCEVDRPVTVAEINQALVSAAKGQLKGILDVSEEPLVSCDFKGNRASSIVDLQSTMVMGSNMVKVLSWYDNEMGFCYRMVDLLGMVG